MTNEIFIRYYTNVHHIHHMDVSVIKYKKNILYLYLFGVSKYSWNTWQDAGKSVHSMWNIISGRIKAYGSGVKLHMMNIIHTTTWYVVITIIYYISHIILQRIMLMLAFSQQSNLDINLLLSCILVCFQINIKCMMHNIHDHLQLSVTNELSF